MKLPSGNRRGDITLLNPGEWLLLRDIEQQQPAESENENENENEIESESDAVFLERVHRDGNDDWLNEFGNLSDVGDRSPTTSVRLPFPKLRDRNV